MKFLKLFLLTASLASSSAALAGTTTLTIGSVGETMAFDKTSLEVKAGDTVKLTLKNNGTSPAMVHNWVLVKAGSENEVGVAGIQAGEKMNYVPKSPNVLASTKLAKPGQSVTLTFTAPKTPGSYPYICTFPGHYALMKGTLIVK